VSSGNGALDLPQLGAMADASYVRHDTLVVPEKTSPAQVRVLAVRVLAQRKAQAQVGEDDIVAFCISTDHGRSAVNMAPRSSGVSATRCYRLASPKFPLVW
jgi:hypothetical protein